MFFSNTGVIVEMKNFQLEHLNNVSFEKDNNFFSLFINKSEEYYTGEMHWSSSFKLGKLDIVHFLIVDNKAVLFTSSVQNFLIFQKIIEHISPDADAHLLKLPLPVPQKEVKSPEIRKIEIDEYFGLTVILDINDEHQLTKIYTNGIVTFSMLVNTPLEEVIRLMKLIINIIEEFHEK